MCVFVCGSVFASCPFLPASNRHPVASAPAVVRRMCLPSERFLLPERLGEGWENVSLYRLLPSMMLLEAGREQRNRWVGCAMDEVRPCVYRAHEPTPELCKDESSCTEGSFLATVRWDAKVASLSENLLSLSAKDYS